MGPYRPSAVGGQGLGSRVMSSSTGGHWGCICMTVFPGEGQGKSCGVTGYYVQVCRFSGDGLGCRFEAHDNRSLVSMSWMSLREIDCPSSPVGHVRSTNRQDCIVNYLYLLSAVNCNYLQQRRTTPIRELIQPTDDDCVIRRAPPMSRLNPQVALNHGEAPPSADYSSWKRPRSAPCG